MKWSMMDHPSGAKSIYTKWVLALKKNERGEIERYKRLVATVCAQGLGDEYGETFLLVAHYSTIRLVMVLAVQWNMYMHQVDISAAYLNSYLQHKIYIRQPQGFVNENYPNKVLRLRKATYALKQSGTEWNSKSDLFLKSFGFRQCNNEPCLYKEAVENELILITGYVL